MASLHFILITVCYPYWLLMVIQVQNKYFKLTNYVLLDAFVAGFLHLRCMICIL